MQKSFTMFLLIALSLFLANCGTEDDKACTPGSTLVCNCTAYKKGVQVCKSDGSGWDICVCEEGNSKNTKSVEGDTCSQTADCFEPLQCKDSKCQTVCGDGHKGKSEICDGDTKGCKDIDSTYTSGDAKCKNDCTGYDNANCEGGSGDTTSVFVKIAAGTFTMGSPSGEAANESDETQHQVTLTYNFEIQSTEVTQGQFKKLMGYNPSDYLSCGDDCPVEKVNWHEALLYCNKLSISKGVEECFECAGNCSHASCGEGYCDLTCLTCSLKSKFSKPQDCSGYRLPTEAEWEYAVRAGTTTAFYNGGITSTSSDPNMDKIGWYKYNSSDYTHVVKGKDANDWGLYDMSGNVYEWAWDWYDKSYGGDVTDPVGPSSGFYRLTRGGSWAHDALSSRSANRGNKSPGTRTDWLGFRPCRSK